jgi:hypothetical protein
MNTGTNIVKPNPHKIVNSFDDLLIGDNSIVLCDIDETILHYNGINRNWWKERFDYHYENYKNYDMADMKSLEDWKEHIYNTQPSITDNDSFRRMITKVNDTGSELYFVTARDSSMATITEKHFDSLNIDFYKGQIHYVGEMSKGIYIKSNFQLTNYNMTLFIDDRTMHLDEVLEINNHLIEPNTNNVPTIYTYHFNMIRDLNT